jgi:hypothetical protein
MKAIVGMLARILTASLVVAAIGCYRWQLAPTARWADPDTDQTLRVTPVGGTPVTLFHARLTTDSVVGSLARSSTAGAQHFEVALPQISTIERREVNGAGVSALVLFGGLALLWGYAFYNKRL